MVRHVPPVRRGMLLVVVLVIIAVLGLLGASFSYWMNADLASVQAMMDRQQARIAAEAGLSRAILLLRTERADVEKWHNNPNAFRRILVWAPDKIGGSESLADQEKVEGQQAWRFSLVASETVGETTKIRYGLTDEASRLNLNQATREQLLTLIDHLSQSRQLDLGNSQVEELADSLIDWRDSDDVPISPFGAESEYYMTLEPRYRAKNRPLQTIEELLMVKGWNGRILFGEDYNRNGYLDDNEDDGPEGAFPPDNGDGILDRGLLPYVTVYSWDFNTGLDNKYRININAFRFSDPDRLPAHIVEDLSPEVIAFIGEAQQRGYRFRSVGELVGLEVYEDGSSNYDELWEQYAAERRLRNRVTEEDEDASPLEGDPDPSRRLDPDGQPSDEDVDLDELDREIEELENRDRGRDTGRDRDRPGDRNTRGDRDTGSRNTDREADNNRDRDRPEDDEGRDRAPGRGAAPPWERGAVEDEIEEPPPPPSDRGRGARDRGRGRAPEGAAGGEPGEAGRGRDRGRGRAAEGAPTGESGDADRERDRGQPLPNPIGAEQMAVLMDRLTVVNQPVLIGQINVNTASAPVLRTIPGLTEADVEAIVSRQQQLGGEDKMTPAWLVTSGALPPEKFALVSNLVTTRSIQFKVDAIGFADHVGAAARIQAVIELRGQLAQIKYYRDVSSLGLGFPVWDDQRSEGFAFDDR